MKTLSKFTLAFMVIFAYSCNKKMPNSNPLPQTTNTSEGASTTNWSALEPSEQINTVQGFLTLLEGNSSGTLSLDDALEHMEAGINYKYARINNPFTDRFFFKKDYPYTTNSNNEISHGDLRAIYDQIKTDIKAYGLATGHASDDLLLNLVDVVLDEEAHVFKIDAIIGYFEDFDPNAGYEPQAITCPTGEDYENRGDGMCSGTAPMTIPFQASASNVGVMYYYDHNHVVMGNGSVGSTTVFNVHSWTVNALLANNDAVYTNPYSLSRAWRDNDLNPDYCMPASEINYYDNTAVQHILDKGRSYLGINGNTDWVYMGSLPCTWVGYSEGIINGSMWFGGELKFGVENVAGYMPNPNLIFQ